MGFMSYIDPGDWLGTQAAEQAADIQERAAEANYNLQRDMFDRLWQDSEATRETRNEALGGINRLNAGGSVQFSPSYETQNQNMLDRNSRQYAARGKLLSGERMMADSAGASALASNEVQRGTNRLLNMAGFSTQDLGNQNRLLGHNVGQQGQALQDAGTAKASGIVGTQNAYNDLMNTGAQIGGYFYGNNNNTPNQWGA